MGGEQAADAADVGFEDLDFAIEVEAAGSGAAFAFFGAVAAAFWAFVAGFVGVTGGRAGCAPAGSVALTVAAIRPSATRTVRRCRALTVSMLVRTWTFFRENESMVKV